MREAFPKKGKAVLVLIHLIKSEPRSPNQRKLKFSSDSCNWTKSEHVRVFTDQARACEGSGVNVLARWQLHTSALCTSGRRGWNLCHSQGQVAPFGGHFCSADVYLAFRCLDLQVMSFALGWKSLLLLWRSPGTVIARKSSPQSSDLPHSAPVLGLRGQFTFCSSAFQAVGEVPAPQGLIWKCAESHHCLETSGYYSLIKGN